jgi:hypothetical protein
VSPVKSLGDQTLIGWSPFRIISTGNNPALYEDGFCYYK